jgi:iron(III) transport system substrate-binding protein
MIAGKPGVSLPLSYVPASAPGSLAISNPQFGTASDWCAAYVCRWGKERALAYFKKLKAANVRVLPGNADVALGVADGHIEYGITDSDDYLSQLREKKKVFLVKTTRDNVLVPGCASMVEGAPHPANARKLMDALVDAETEAELVKGMPGVFSVRHLNEDSNWKAGGQDFSFLKTNGRTDAYSEWRPAWESIRAPLADILTP